MHTSTRRARDAPPQPAAAFSASLSQQASTSVKANQLGGLRTEPVTEVGATGKGQRGQGTVCSEAARWRVGGFGPPGLSLLAPRVDTAFHLPTGYPAGLSISLWLSQSEMAFPLTALRR